MRKTQSLPAAKIAAANSTSSWESSEFRMLWWICMEKNLLQFHKNTVGIRNPTILNLDFLKAEFQMVQFSNGRALDLALAIVLTIWKQFIQNPDVFVWNSNVCFQNGGHLSWFQMVGLQDFKSHSKFVTFATQPLFDHSKYILVRISDPPPLYTFLKLKFHTAFE